MKLIALLRKTLAEQLRQFWVVLLTVSMAPFFVGIFYLIYQSESLNLRVSIVNASSASQAPGQPNYDQQLIIFLQSIQNDTLPIHFKLAESHSGALEDIRNRKTDALLIIPADFNDSLQARKNGEAVRVPFELSGNLAETNYMLAAIWTHAYVASYINTETAASEPYRFTETPVGMAANMDEFSMAIPGLLVLATVMLMFSGALAFVNEPEKLTMLRLKLSYVSPFTFLSGISIVQIALGLISILLTLLVAVLLGFTISGSLALFFLVGILTSLSMVGFSLLLAGLTKSANEVLVVGNFPMFLFMFFSGTMFPMHGATLYSFAGYQVTVPGLMSTYHATEALKKITVFGSGFADIWPELLCLSCLTMVYFIIGYWVYRKRHMDIF